MKKTVLTLGAVAFILAGCNGSPEVKEAHPKHGKAHEKHWDYGTVSQLKLLTQYRVIANYKF